MKKQKNQTNYFDIIQLLKNIHLIEYISNIYTRKNIFFNLYVFYITIL